METGEIGKKRKERERERRKRKRMKGRKRGNGEMVTVWVVTWRHKKEGG